MCITQNFTNQWNVSMKLVRRMVLCSDECTLKGSCLDHRRGVTERLKWLLKLKVLSELQGCRDLAKDLTLEAVISSCNMRGPQDDFVQGVV
jgi:hypothetical protein